MRFADRVDAGRRLAQVVLPLFTPVPGAPAAQAVVLGLPRGGVPVAAQVAAALGAELDVIVVRKLGVPRQPELAMGAVGEDGVCVLEPATISAARVSPDQLAQAQEREREQVERRVRLFRGDRPGARVEDRTVVVVDDGIATGATMRAACRIVAARGARWVIAAVPVAAGSAQARLAGEAGQTVCLQTPSPFIGVGRWYHDFSPTSDAEVIALLDQARHPQ